MIHDMQNTQAMVEVSLRIKQVLKKIKKKTKQVHHTNSSVRGHFIALISSSIIIILSTTTYLS